jgi:hypothetical protein
MEGRGVEYPSASGFSAASLLIFSRPTPFGNNHEGSIPFHLLRE